MQKPSKKAIILDLDNTIYPVSAIGEKLFHKLFSHIEESGDYKGDLDEIRKEIMRRPFQSVVRDFSFGDQLVKESMELLNNLTYDERIEPFKGYEIIRDLPCQKFLVTTGFTKLQHSKIRQLGIEHDFSKIYVVDPAITDLKKKDIFQEILQEHAYTPNEVLVVGDDLESEIKAAKELGIEAVLYMQPGQDAPVGSFNIIHSLKEISSFI